MNDTTKVRDPVADFERRWPKDSKPLTSTMAAFRKLSEAQAYRLKAQIDYEDALRRLFEAESELEFTKQITRKN